MAVGQQDCRAVGAHDHAGRARGIVGNIVFLQGLVIALVYLWPVLLIAVAVVFILRKVWKKRPKKEKLPKPAQTPPPAEYPVKPSDEPKPKY